MLRQRYKRKIESSRHIVKFLEELSQSAKIVNAIQAFRFSIRCVCVCVCVCVS
jgi:hypothetical protein